jgi:MFS family permease
MKVSTIIAFIGAGITTGAVESGMLIAGRTVTGIATGAILSIMPAYISEISRREQRALLVGIMGMSDAVGYMLANWIGFAGEFASKRSRTMANPSRDPSSWNCSALSASYDSSSVSSLA